MEEEKLQSEVTGEEKANADEELKKEDSLNTEAGDKTRCEKTYLSEEQVQQMVVEAEERGYIRGKNEKIEISLKESETSSSREEEERNERRLVILRSLRRSKWEEA